MRSKFVAVAHAVKSALWSAEARPLELRLLRLVAIAVATQAGIDISHWVH